MSAADAYAGDPVVAAARGLTAAARAYAPVTERMHRDAAQIRTRLDGVAARHSLARSVLVVDDSAEALLALCTILSGVAPLLAVTHDRTVVAALRNYAEPVLVPDYARVASVWSRHRPAVTVIDEHLGERSGTEIAAGLPREARVVVVTSHHGARDSLTEATSIVRASAVIRTDVGEWTERLRDEVLRALADACG